MTGQWFCITCHQDRAFAVFDNGGFQFLLCQTCGGGFCIDPEPEPVVPTEGDAA